MARSSSKLATAVRRIRKERGLTQAQLATLAGVSLSTIERVEAGTCSQAETVSALELALDAPGEILPLRDALSRRRVRYRAARAYPGGIVQLQLGAAADKEHVRAHAPTGAGRTGPGTAGPR